MLTAGIDEQRPTSGSEPDPVSLVTSLEPARTESDAAPTDAIPTRRFAFGRNWRRFVHTCLTEDRVAEAERSLQAFLGLRTFAGRSFLDVGCGSGLFSLAAHRLGAARVVSFDVDEDCVECCRAMHRWAGAPPAWEIAQGSALDGAFLDTLEPADIVYSWGVLHHTGRLWEAVERVARLVRPGGTFYLGIYNHLEGERGSDYWRGVKNRYNRSSRPRQRLMELAFILRRTILPNVRRGINPLRVMRDYRGRGMSYFTDVIDWLGGQPYEVATPGDVLRFFRDRYGYSLENLNATNGWGVNEYLLRRPPLMSFGPSQPL